MTIVDIHNRQVVIIPLIRKGDTLVHDNLYDITNFLHKDTIIKQASNLTDDLLDKVMEIDEACSYWESVDDVFYKTHDMSIRSTCSSSLDAFKTLLISKGIKLECFPDMVNETSDFISQFKLYEDALILINL